MRNKIRKGLAAALIVFCLPVIMVTTKRWNMNSFIAKHYPVQGIDVSHYQGEIDWKVLETQGIDFVFIKSTEGSSHVDECFSDNWKEAEQTELLVGAYHFFSFDSAGATQAEHFIHTVGDLSGKLMPVVDVEYYGGKRNNPPGKDAVICGLREMLERLEAEYQVKPAIYTTYSVYKRYIEGSFTEYPLWIRSVYVPPGPSAADWTFWQYTDTAVLKGYKGPETYMDRNVFRGTKEELEKMLVNIEAVPAGQKRNLQAQPVCFRNASSISRSFSG